MSHSSDSEFFFLKDEGHCMHWSVVQCAAEWRRSWGCPRSKEDHLYSPWWAPWCQATLQSWELLQPSQPWYPIALACPHPKRQQGGWYCQQSARFRALGQVSFPNQRPSTKAYFRPFAANMNLTKHIRKKKRSCCLLEPDSAWVLFF